jgi:hypothetical protein
MAVLIGVRARPGRQQHKEKTDHGHMGDLTDVKRPGRPGKEGARTDSENGEEPQMPVEQKR